MPHDLKSAPLPSFKRPPVNELSFGIVFQTLTAFQTRHFGQFWYEHQEEYPTTEDQNPLLELTDVEAQRLVLLDIPPLRRVWLYSQDRQYVAQVQDSRVHFNWRKPTPDTEYPRFPVIYKRFYSFWSQFTEFVERERIGTIAPLRYELAYINHIELGQKVADSLEQHVKLFKFSPIDASYVSPPETVNATWKFAMPDQRGTGVVTLSNGKDSKGRNILVLALTCSGTPSNKFTVADWFESGHEWIVRGFTDLTTTNAHEEWLRER